MLVEELGADRIGHGVRVLEDRDLTARIADAGILCEVCPTSNFLLGVVDDIVVLRFAIGGLLRRLPPHIRQYAHERSQGGTGTRKAQARFRR